MRKIIITILAICTVTFATFAQNVYIPDANFKAKLLANNSLNTDFNKLEISIDEAFAFKGMIDVGNSNIVSMTGINFFINLTSLRCNNNQLTSLDLTNNKALTNLTCFSNKLSSLDVTYNTALIGLGCSGNQLTFLDVSKNTALTELICSNNQLSFLYIANNTALNRVDFSNNKITSINLSKNTVLNIVDLTNN